MKNKVNIFLAVVTVLAILFAIFELSKSGYHGISYEEHEKNMQMLSDTIEALRKNITRYEEQVDKIGLERDNLRKEIKRILSDGESVNRGLSAGDWDTNVKFLAEFLSESGSDRH